MADSAAARLESALRGAEVFIDLGINPIVNLNKKTATEYDTKPGINWLGCTVK